MGFIRDLFTTGGGGDQQQQGHATGPRAQNVWRSVFNPGSPAQRGKGSAQWSDKPEGEHRGSVMDEIVRAPSIKQAHVSGPSSSSPEPAASSSPAGTPRPSLDAGAAPRKEAAREFGGMDKHPFGA